MGKNAIYAKSIELLILYKKLPENLRATGRIVTSGKISVFYPRQLRLRSRRDETV